MDSRLLVRTAELLSDGTVASALFSGMVTVFVPTTGEYIIMCFDLVVWEGAFKFIYTEGGMCLGISFPKLEHVSSLFATMVYVTLTTFTEAH